MKNFIFASTLLVILSTAEIAFAECVTITNPDGGTQTRCQSNNQQQNTISYSNHNENVIKEIYRSVLGREADAGGLAYWKIRLDAGVPESAIRAAFGYSAEGASLVNSLYVQYLGRNAEEAGLHYWMGVLGSHGLGVVQYHIMYSDESRRRNGI